ncbi:hypothetical protein RIR_jg31146.t1 [Rhizophagus irregularis DAOM 181602=DAOM 197198]|nr:hypothetical protein RhiirB3_79502 [Rhizophagus irregularis]GET53895.1 hypothetical protein RIR_jg31146.t1 [Rhizophagus irregularis DAOM 181602=DAOM 197198]
MILIYVRKRISYNQIVHSHSATMILIYVIKLLLYILVKNTLNQTIQPPCKNASILRPISSKINNKAELRIR